MNKLLIPSVLFAALIVGAFYFGMSDNSQASFSGVKSDSVSAGAGVVGDSAGVSQTNISPAPSGTGSVTGTGTAPTKPSVKRSRGDDSFWGDDD